MTGIVSQPLGPAENKPDRTTVLVNENNAAMLLEHTERLGLIGHWQMSLPDHAITWSAETCRIHGVTPDHRVPDLETAVSLYHLDDRAPVMAAVAAATQHGMPFEFDTRLILPDGKLRYLKGRGLTIPISADAPACLFGVFIDVTAQRECEASLRETTLKLEQTAYVDPLTQVANQRQFNEILEREWRRAIREQTSLSLVILDIDKFQMFNHHYGHSAGDDCLRAVAAALRWVAQRPGDLVIRYRDAAFALILPTTESEGAKKVAESARSAIAALGLTNSGNSTCGGVVTASVGVPTAYPQFAAAPATAWLDLVTETAGLLHEAKRTGRNRVVSLTDIASTTPLLANEETRLAILWAYEQTGATAHTAELDRLAKLAATLTHTPVGLISLVERHEQRFVGNFGLTGVSGTHRAVSICAHTILGDEPFVVPDATRDSRFKDNPLVTGDFGLRYYAGAPIVSEATGHRLGALCVIDKSARADTSQSHRALLTDLAKLAAMLIQEKVTSPTGLTGNVA